MFILIKKMFMALLIVIDNASNHAKSMSLSKQECMIQPTLINLHPNNGVRNFFTIHLQLSLRDVFEVVILIMTYLIKYVFQIKQKI